MRLVCPSCSAAYDVPDNAIPAPGRKVRCQACGEVWHQNVADPVDPGGHEGDEFGELLRSVLLDGPETPPAKPAPGRRAGQPDAPRKGLRRPVWAAAGAISGLVAAGALMAGIVMARPVLEPALPSIMPFYEWVLGRPADPLAGLAFDRMALAPEPGGGVRLTGMLINLTSKDISLPSLSIVWSDAEGKTVAAIPLPLLAGHLVAETAWPLDHLFAEVPEGAVSLQVAFGPVPEQPVP